MLRDAVPAGSFMLLAFAASCGSTSTTHSHQSHGEIYIDVRIPPTKVPWDIDYTFHDGELCLLRGTIGNSEVTAHCEQSVGRGRRLAVYDVAAGQYSVWYAPGGRVERIDIADGGLAADTSSGLLLTFMSPGSGSGDVHLSDGTVVHFP